MSSPAPSAPSRAPTPPFPRDNCVATWTAYEGRQQEYERHRDARRVWELARARAYLFSRALSLLPTTPLEVLRSNEVSVPKAGPVPAAAAPLALGQLTPVPEDARVSMEDASTEAVTKALRRPWGPPTRKWCLANSLAGQAGASPGIPGRPVTEAGSSGSHVFLPRSGRPLLSVGVPQSHPEESQAVAVGPGSEEAELRRERDRGLVQIQAQAEELTRARHEQDEAVLVRDQLLRERVGHPGQHEALEGEVGGLLTRLVRAVGLEGMAGVTVPSAAEVDKLACRLHKAHTLEIVGVSGYCGKWRWRGVKPWVRD
ncbi:hypothetical protein C0992_007682 [Termitomyces sp. T32_za158]|nr:hypothetical protein C0992_007682 [Termitomyces sp. T32_za158]